MQFKRTLLAVTFVALSSLGGCPPQSNPGGGTTTQPSNDVWKQAAELKAPDAAQGDKFGEAVAVDGDTILIGAPDKNRGNGAAYVFTRAGGWALQTELPAPPDLKDNGQFGVTVAISGDIALIGATNQAPPNSLLFLTGGVYFLQRSGSTWSAKSELIPTNAASQDYLGSAVAIDGNTMIAGAFGRNNLQGAAYISELSNGNFALPAEVHPDASGFDWFGFSAGISGNTAIVGAYGQEAAYIFTGSGANWPQQQKLTPPTQGGLDAFGQAVAVSGDTAVVGAPNYQSQTGQVHIFTRSGTTWSLQQTLPSPEPGGRLFGYAVAIDGDTVVVGAPKSAAALVYVRSGTTWSQQQRITPSGPEDLSQGFGVSVAIRGNTIVVGAEINSDAAAMAGAAFAFERQP